MRASVIPPSLPRAGQLAALALAALASACSEPVAPVVLEAKPPGLEAEPRWLTFECVKPGCDTTLEVTVREIGTRRLAIKRVVLSEPDRTDFEVSSSLTPPAVPDEGSFKVSVRYRPSGAEEVGDLKLLVTYTDASPDESGDRVPPGELSVPLLRRLVGEPVLVATPEKLVFGAVASGQIHTLPLTLSNAGFGNTSLAIAAIESDSPDFVVGALPAQGLAPEQSAEVQVTFVPLSERYSEAKLTVRTADDLVAPVEITAVGTSLSAPKASVSPAEGIDFGRVPKGTPNTASVELSNRGGADLVISAVAPIGNANLRASLPEGATHVTLAPLESTTVALELSAQTAGAIAARIEISTNDPSARTLRVPVIGMVTEPKTEATPSSLDFGGVPRGWVQTKPISVRNAGWGALEVRALTLVLGSSNLFTLRSVPSLPVTLERDQRLGLEVEYRAEVSGSFDAALSIETNDPNSPFLEVPIAARSVTCAEGCPLPHATPSCAGGECSITSCSSNWFDTDGQAANGCECSETGNDPGGSCQDSIYLGELVDNEDDTASFQGVLPAEDDVDVLRFYAKDAWSMSDQFHVKVQLTSADSSIRFCVYRHAASSHQGDCYWQEESCPSNRLYDLPSGGNGGDDADFIVKVFRAAGSAPTCSGYSLAISNGI